MTLETSRISVPVDSEHAMIVRQFVRLACHRYGCDAVTDNVLQVTDELVANAVEHAASDGEGPGAQTLEVGIVPTQRGVRIEVHDGSHRHPEEGLSESDEQQGLRIVATLASSWGVDDEPDGKTVWAEMSGPDGAAGETVPR